MEKRISKTEWVSQEEIFATSYLTFDLIRKHCRDLKISSGTAIDVYLFYCKCASVQETKKVFATNRFVAGGLNIGPDTVSKYRQVLLDIGCIKDIPKRDDKGKYIGSYVNVLFAVNPNNINTKDWENGDMEKPYDGESNTNTEGYKTEILNDKNINTVGYKDNNIDIKKNENDFGFSDAVNDAIDDFIQHRKDIKKPMTPRALELLVNNLASWELPDEDLVDAINSSIMRGYQGVFKPQNKGQRYTRLDSAIDNISNDTKSQTIKSSSNVQQNVGVDIGMSPKLKDAFDRFIKYRIENGEKIGNIQYEEMGKALLNYQTRVGMRMVNVSDNEKAFLLNRAIANGRKKWYDFSSFKDYKSCVKDMYGEDLNGYKRLFEERKSERIYFVEGAEQHNRAIDDKIYSDLCISHGGRYAMLSMIEYRHKGDLDSYETFTGPHTDWHTFTK